MAGVMLLLACTTWTGPGARAIAPPDLLAFAGETVTLSAAGSIGEVTWSFGDGAEGVGLEVDHQWAEPGRYTVRVEASAEGPPDADTLTVRVVNAPLAQPPVASGLLASSGWGEIFAVLTDFDAVAVVEDGTSTLMAFCERPLAVSWSGALRVGCGDGQLVQSFSSENWRLDLGEPVVAVAGDWALTESGWLVEVVDGAEVQRLRAVPGRGLVVSEGVPYTARFKSPEEGGVVWSPAGTGELPRHLGPDSDTDARGLPNLLGTVGMRPDGGSLVIGGLKANTERGLYVEGTALEPDKMVRALLQPVDPATLTVEQAPLFDNRDRVAAVAYSPLGDVLAVAHAGAEIVDLLDPYTFQRIGGFQAVGSAPAGLLILDTTLWVFNLLDREVVAYRLDAGNEQVEVNRIALVEEEVLPEEVLWGQQIFTSSADPRMSHDAYIACASCHPDGGEDGRTWDFTQRGGGLRNTLPIWALPTDGPFHWSANFDELQDFENDIRLHQEGLGFMGDEDWGECADPLGPQKAGRSAELDALAAYMRWVAPPPALGGEAEDGAVFESLCGDCHAGEELTDAGWADGEPVLHDVGTLTEASGQRLGAELTGLRTPSLLGVRHSAPYLHDGSAERLEQAVSAHVDGLSEEQLSAVVRWMEGL